MRSVFCLVCSTRCGVCGARTACRSAPEVRRPRRQPPPPSRALIRAANSTRFSSGNAREMPARSTFSNATTSTSARRFFVPAPSLVRRWRLMGRTEPLGVAVAVFRLWTLPALPRVTSATAAAETRQRAHRLRVRGGFAGSDWRLRVRGVSKSSAGEDFAPAGSGARRRRRRPRRRCHRSSCRAWFTTRARLERNRTRAEAVS